MLNSLTDDTARAVAVALVQSRLDYGNSILYGITKFNLTKLQQVQNSVAHIVLRHHPNFSTDLIRELHWLPIEKRIKLKLATITYNAFSSHQPPYLFSPLSTCLQLHIYPMLHQPTSSRHSQMQNWVWQTRVQLLRSFSLVRHLCRNSICPSITICKHHLKTHFFGLIPSHPTTSPSLLLLAWPSHSDSWSHPRLCATYINIICNVSYKWGSQYH